MLHENLCVDESTLIEVVVHYFFFRLVTCVTKCENEGRIQTPKICSVGGSDDVHLISSWWIAICNARENLPTLGIYTGGKMLAYIFSKVLTQFFKHWPNDQKSSYAMSWQFRLNKIWHIFKHSANMDLHKGEKKKLFWALRVMMHSDRDTLPSRSWVFPTSHFTLETFNQAFTHHMWLQSMMKLSIKK